MTSLICRVKLFFGWVYRRYTQEGLRRKALSQQDTISSCCQAQINKNPWQNDVARQPCVIDTRLVTRDTKQNVQSISSVLCFPVTLHSQTVTEEYARLLLPSFIPTPFSFFLSLILPPCTLPSFLPNFFHSRSLPSFLPFLILSLPAPFCPSFLPSVINSLPPCSLPFLILSLSVPFRPSFWS